MRSHGLKIAVNTILFAYGICLLANVARADSADTDKKKSDATTRDSLEEVVVTARKTEESLQEVPISISVLSGDFLDKARLANVENVLIRVPGIGFGQPFKSYTPIAIRGASTQDDSIGVDPNVAIFIDGVNVGSTTSIEFDLLDLERVEVLKGPQGTTFGRNTNGGVINYVTRRPSSEFRSAVDFTLGNYDRMETSGYVNGEITDNLDGIISMRIRNSGGYVKNLATGNMLGQDKVSTFRGKLLYQPTDKLDILLGADLMVDDSYGIPRYFNGPRPWNLPPDAPFSSNFNHVAQDLDGSYDRVGKGASLTMDYDSEIGTWHSITAWRDYDNKLHNFDFDAVDGRTSDGLNTTEGFNYQKTTLSAWSQEIRLDWRVGGVVDGIAGIYLLDEDQYRIESLAASGMVGSAWWDDHGGEDLEDDILDQSMNTKSAGIFVDAHFHLTDQWTLSPGLRYTHDKKSGSTQCWQVGAFFCADTYKVKYDDSWTEPTWRVILSYQANPNIMSYLSAASGYKSGGFSNSASGDGTAEEVAPLLSKPYKPEYTMSYEAGLRLTLLDGSMTLNPTLFYVEYTDIQFLYLLENSNSFISGNIGGGQNQGIEVDWNWRAMDNLSFWASYSFQDSEYTKGSSYDVPIKGNQLQLTPRNSFTAGFTYTQAFSNGQSLEFSGDVVEKTVQYDDATNDPVASTAFKDLWNLRLNYSATEHSTIALWVTNLLDKRNALGTNQLGYFIYPYAQLEAEPEAWGSTQRTYTEPRSYGLTFRYTF